MRPFVFVFSIVLWAPSLFARDGVIALKTEKTHLQIFMQPDLPVLEFRNSKKEIKVRLDHKGLFAGAKLLCSWPGGQFAAKDESNMVLGINTPVKVFTMTAEKVDYTPCPADSPVKSIWGDGGTGPAALYVEVEKVDGSRAEVKFRGEVLYLDLPSLKEKFRVQPPKSLSNEPGD